MRALALSHHRLHRHIGGLENVVEHEYIVTLLHRHIGGLENTAQNSRCKPSSSPPHRRLRKIIVKPAKRWLSSPPHRRLRKHRQLGGFLWSASPPHRRLRKHPFQNQ